MNNDSITEKPSFLAEMQFRQLFQVILIGAVVGLISWGVSLLAYMYIFKPVLCSPEAVSCSSGNQYGLVVAALLAAGIGLFLLIKVRLFRPLLIVIAATISLWGLVGILESFPWYGALGVTMFLYACAYSLFAWIVRIRAFWVVVILLVSIIVAARLLLMR